MTPPNPPGGPTPPRPVPRALPRLTKGRPRLKPLRERNPIGVAAVGVALLLVLGMLAFRADDLPVIGGGTTYSAYFSEAAGLKDGQEVRVAGVKVGKVTAVELEGNKVKVTFRVKDTWVGNATRAMIMIKTLLGSKYLQLDPLGYRRQDPRETIPLDRTIAPYDVTTAFEDLGRTFDRLDTAKLAASLETISTTFEDTPPSVRVALHGLSSLSNTIASRDAELARLLAGTKQLSGTIAAQNAQFQTLFKDGNLLLGELRPAARRDPRAARRHEPPRAGAGGPRRRQPPHPGPDPCLPGPGHDRPRTQPEEPGPGAGDRRPLHARRRQLDRQRPLGGWLPVRHRPQGVPGERCVETARHRLRASASDGRPVT
ncbi:MCE family protein [Actinomadura madurae]|uniref:MCE family protein n=1 Tax=Actinomadura madurae TaxID=1993 RepID=UPI0020D23D7A|nr:MCE family protein [Actinomadura madurae]MCP9982967.1 MCE family protein [Actinomadura madurae]